MPDNSKKPEQSASSQHPTKEQIGELPERPVTERDADAVKGGVNMNKGPHGKS
ncbi:MAG: hypothetical protein ACREPM_13370 [Gemmatimonadaceae bacterium]